MDRGNAVMKRLIKPALALLALVAIAYVLLRTPDTDPAEMRAKYGATPSQFVELDGGLTVHMRDEGPNEGNPEDPALGLLHGTNAEKGRAWGKDRGYQDV